MVHVLDNVVVNYVLQHLTTYVGQGHWPIIAGSAPIAFLEEGVIFAAFQSSGTFP